MGLFEKLFGTRSQRELKKIQPMVDKILALEAEYKNLSEEALKGKTREFKNRLEEGETLDDLLPEAFAAIREAADRVLGLRPYPVQLIGGIVLHQGRIAEMKTGEGKTLVAILPCYLNALTGRGVHVVTVNDYLAKYQSEWMGKVYRYMGLTIGLVIPGMTPAERRVAYAADITYCTNNELGFDYLRDNMAIYKQELVQRGHAFAIVDEDGVHLVHDGEGMAPLDQLLLVDGHVVPKVVKAQLVVGAVSNVCGVGHPALSGAHAGDHQADGQAHVAIDLAHPLRLVLGQVIVDGDHMDTFPGQGVEVAGQDGHQGLAFTGLHFRDPALVQHDAADELDRVGAHAQNPVRSFPDGGEGLGQQVVQGFPLGQAVFKFLGLAPEGFLRKISIFTFQPQDLVHHGLDLFQLPLRPGAEEFVK